MTETYPQWFEKKYKRLCKLVKKRGISFFGLGMYAVDKHGNWDKEVATLLLELMEYEPFLEFLRKEVIGLHD